MIMRPSSAILPALALAFGIAGSAQPAMAAGAQGRATAVIKSGISIRSAADPAAGPLIQSAQADWPPPRTVLRPCRPGDSQSVQQCRLVLLELQ